MHKFINIQFLRAVAATLVVLFHLIPHFNQTDWLVPELFGFLTQFAYAGVDVFFVISGYVIWISSQTNQHSQSSVQFFYNRFTRIYLGYWPYFLMFLGMVYWLNMQRLDQVDLIGSLFLTQISINKLLLPIAWTLTYEMYFYVCFTVLLLLPRVMLKPVIKSLFLFIIAIQGYHIIVNDIYAIENFPYIPFYLTFLTSPFCLEFLVGCMLGMFFEKHRISHLKSLVFAAIGIFILGIYYQQQHVMPEGLMSQGYYLPQRALFWGTVSALLVACVVEADKRGTVIFKRTSQLFGGASYSIYLSHIPIIYFFKELGYITYLKNNMAFQELGFLLILAVILAYSVIHYWYIEQPLMRASKGLWRRMNGTSLSESRRLG